ncbi:RNA-binding transcriptional accessory protein [Neiella sp. HB171785]|uniref:RNA-binding transcriptional accessory protein n=1 Tax=Neiella litorisoli TaxID=2771431 RepID=A0A8J6QKS9_9GAMM|nr:Tex family protein [Neiella litorisoli]MBD1391119.1 RNA-binding transcriptional accessory protein [Neiella litorisoli]
MQNISQQIAVELNASPAQVNAAVSLLDEGATVPFIARYRKEATGGLDDSQLRLLEQRLGYLRELNDRRDTILKSIDQQGKLTPELQEAIRQADSKSTLEDLYLPYKPKRRTKGQIAIEAGLEPLADELLNAANGDPEHMAQAYVDEQQGVADTKAALDGARYILMERLAEDAQLVGQSRNHLQRHGMLTATVMMGQEQNGQKFSDYFDHSEQLTKVPSHRALAMLRGRNEGILQLKVTLPEDVEPGEQLVASHLRLSADSSALGRWRIQLAQWTWRIKLLLQLENELLGQLREQAEQEAIEVFARNLNDLLMAAPAGHKATMGLDPGLRTGVKVAVVDATGKLLDTATIYPHVPQKQWQQSLATLATLVKKHAVELIAIGNGTASRETDKLAGELVKALAQPNLQKIMVSEAGASVYSASELAAQEFPDLDVSLRGAVSIARRLQDPLAELVKIDPKSIGVGQYQHDVNQTQLGTSLTNVVEDCVNAVGVDVNTASAPLLTRVAGLNRVLAQNIVDYRNANGAFAERKQLLKVARLGAKTYEQCAGFLKVVNGKNPLDASSVHPEAYPVVKRILAHNSWQLSDIMGQSGALKKLNVNDYTDDQFGVPTVTDIFAELEKPGRDPRPEFTTASFKDGVETLADLKPNMILEGVVTNVTNFGAFVDIGVHQDGLVHISALADRYISNPADVVKAGQVVKVKVMEVDIARKRIALTMRMGDVADSTPKAASEPRAKQERRSHRNDRSRQQSNAQPANNAFAEAFANAKRK